MRFRTLLLAACAVGALSVTGTAHAADKLRLMIGGMNKQIYLPAKLTDQLGYFKEQGLDVEMTDEPAGVEAEDAMLAGEVDGVVGFYDHNVDLQSKGKSTEAVFMMLRAPGEVELCSSKKADKIKSPADWKGANLGVTGLGSSTNFLTQYLAVKNGLKLSDIHSVAVGAGNTFIAAMQQGAIDCGMTTEPTVSRLLKTGEGKILVDMRSPEQTKAALGGTYPASSVYMQTAWVNKHPEIVQKMVNAMVKTMKFIHDHSAAEIAEKMPADYYAGDKAMYISALENGKAMYTEDGRMPEGGPEIVLKVLSTFDKTVQGKKIDLDKTYTMKFVDAAK